MNPILLTESEAEDKVKSIAARLSRPFVTEDVKFRPIGKPWDGTIEVAAFIDARSVVERLNDVMGLDGWQDDYETLQEGEVRCRLRLKLLNEWIVRTDVGSMSDQPDIGDRAKAAHSDGLKRAAVKFGVGLYVYRLKGMRAAYDGKKVTTWPTLPLWAVAEECQPAGREMGNKLVQLLAQCCAKAKCEQESAKHRLFTKFGNYAKTVQFAAIEMRDARAMLQDLNQWVNDLSKTPTKPAERQAS